jgi:hypothetical protein
MYSKEYKNWIARKSKSPPIVKTINSFKEYSSRAIAPVNQTTAPASQHGYNMAAVEDNVFIASYNETLTNFGAAYAATQETIKSQATSLATMQGQLANIQQFCMAVGQLPPSNIYAPTQNQRTSNNCGIRRNGKGQGGGGAGGGNQQPTWYAPTPYKRWENQNYCHTHGGDIEDCHMSGTFRKPGPTHNPHATCTNTMDGSAAGMHKTILPLVSGCTAPNRRPQQQQLSHQRRPIAHYPAQGMTWQQAPPPAHFSGMPPAGGSYRQQTNMAILVSQPGQAMMNFVGQNPPDAGTALMMQLPNQQASPMMAPYYAPNQQPYHTNTQLPNQYNQQPQGYYF